MSQLDKSQLDKDPKVHRQLELTDSALALSLENRNLLLRGLCIRVGTRNVRLGLGKVRSVLLGLLFGFIACGLNTTTGLWRIWRTMRIGSARSESLLITAATSYRS